jgi:hypothetical protein
MNQANGNTRLARLLLRVAGITNALMFCTLCCEATANGAAGIMAVMLLPLGFWVVALLYATSQGLWFEKRCERVWKTACSGLDGFRGVARSYRFGLIGAFVLGDTKTIYPKLRDVHGTRESWTGMITPFGGQDPSDYNKVSEKFAFSFMVPATNFEAAEDGRILIRAGKVPVPDAYAFTGHVQASSAYNNQPLLQQPPRTQQTQFIQPVPKQTMSLDEVPPGALRAVEHFQQSRGVPMASNADVDYRQATVYARELELLKAVPMARDLNGRVCKIPIEGQHWFDAARTNGGKSSWNWGLVLRLGPAWAAGLVEWWGIDSKWCELGFELGWWEHYASKDAECVELLEAAVLEMQARLQSMQGFSRKFTPSVLTPLNVVVIDEMAYLTAYQADRKLRERAQAAISALLSAGRAPGFAVIAAVQDPRKEVCGFRDLFSIRIAGGMPAPMVDLVLGEGMYDLGARCEQIPMGAAGAGAAYVISETTLKPIYVRAPWCSDEVIKQAYLKYSAIRARRMTHTDQLQIDDLSGQLDWNGQPLQQWQYKVE